MISTIVLPKVQRSSDVPRLISTLKNYSAHGVKKLVFTEWLRSRLRVIPLIESPLGLIDLRFIFRDMRTMEGFKTATGHDVLAARKVPAAVVSYFLPTAWFYRKFS